LAEIDPAAPSRCRYIKREKVNNLFMKTDDEPLAQAVLFFVENDFEGSHGYAGRTKWIDWKAWTPCQAITVLAPSSQIA
jgi:hypothetical protein